MWEPSDVLADFANSFRQADPSDPRPLRSPDPSDPLRSAIDTAGKVVVVDFWATYCEPCVREIPGLNKLMDYPVALGTPALGTKYGVEGFPATLIFDRSGKLVQLCQFTAEADMRRRSKRCCSGGR
jgi:thiol-disulfide isomerase/thioredoxin